MKRVTASQHEAHQTAKVNNQWRIHILTADEADMIRALRQSGKRADEAVRLAIDVAPITPIDVLDHYAAGDRIGLPAGTQYQYAIAAAPATTTDSEPVESTQVDEPTPVTELTTE